MPKQAKVLGVHIYYNIHTIEVICNSSIVFYITENLQITMFTKFSFSFLPSAFLNTITLCGLEKSV